MEQLIKSQSIIIPRTREKNKAQEILGVLNDISSTDINNIGEEIANKDEEKKRRDEKKDKEFAYEQFKGDISAILSDLEKNHTKTRLITVNNIFCKVIDIDFPPVNNFKGYKLSYCVSTSEISKDAIEKDDRLKNNLCSLHDVTDILDVIREYLFAYGVVDDKDVDYRNILNNRKSLNKNSNILAYFRRLTGLYKSYWLKDYNSIKPFGTYRRYIDCTHSLEVDEFILGKTYAYFLLKKEPQK